MPEYTVIDSILVCTLVSGDVVSIGGQYFSLVDVFDLDDTIRLVMRDEWDNELTVNLDPYSYIDLAGYVAEDVSV